MLHPPPPYVFLKIKIPKIVFSPRVVVQTKPGDDVWAFENWWTQRLHNCCEQSDICEHIK
jgi:hypothetical protein